MIKKYQKTAQLFDYQTMASGTVGAYLLSDGSLRSEGSWAITDYIPCDGTAFVLNKVGGNAPSICFYDSNKNYISGQGYGTGAASIKSIIYATATSNAKYIRFSYMTSTNPDDLTQIMLNSGSTALPYEPYGNTFKDWFYREYGTETETFTTLPHEVIGDGQSNLTWSMDGNMQVNGTPTPQNPITPQETGDKTANLFDYTTMADGINNFYLDKYGVEQSSNSWVITDYIPVSGRTFSLTRSAAGFSPSICLYDSTKTFIAGAEYNGSNVVTITANQDVYYVRFSHYKSSQEDITQAMLNVGQPMNYEPYGYYKIPILSNGASYPVYLAEPIRKISTYVDSVPSTGSASRVIKKLVLTGEETWYKSIMYQGSFYAYDMIDGKSSYLICSHAVFAFPLNAQNYIYGTFSLDGTPPFNLNLYIGQSSWSIDDFKQYLADQYTAGTPVTVWYILETATTESFTAPTIPTSGTAQSFDVDTTLKPSEVSLTYHGWHEHSDEKYVGGVVNKFNKDDSSLLYSSTNLAATAQWSYGGTGTTIRIPCKSSQAYTLSCNIDTTVWRISCVESENVPSDGNPVTTVDIVRSKPTSGVYTFTTTANTKYVLFQCGVSVLSEAVAILMLVEGSTAPSEYHPYYEWVEE